MHRAKVAYGCSIMLNYRPPEGGKVCKVACPGEIVTSAQIGPNFAELVDQGRLIIVTDDAQSVRDDNPNPNPGPDAHGEVLKLPGNAPGENKVELVKTVKVGEAVGKWVLDPAKLEGKSLDELNALVAELDPAIEPFSTEAEAIAWLSQDYAKSKAK